MRFFYFNMKPISLNYKNPDKISQEQCIFKIWAGTHYFVWKTNGIRPLMNRVADQITKEMLVPKKDSIFSKLVTHCLVRKITELSIEVIKNYPTDQHALLMDEYNLLQASKKDKKCLNKDFVNHKSYPRWITQESMNNFKIYYTQGKNVGSSIKDKNLRKFLNGIVYKEMTGDEFVERIFTYVKTRYK